MKTFSPEIIEMYENCQTKQAYETAVKEGFEYSLTHFCELSDSQLQSSRNTKDRAMADHFNY